MSRLRSENGQGLVEYALVLVLVAVILIGILQALGPVVSERFGAVVDAVRIAGGQPSGAIAGVSATRVWSWFSWHVRVGVSVSQPDTLVSVDITEGGGHVDPSKTCSPEDDCVFWVHSPTFSGTVRAAGGGGAKTASW